MTNVVSQFLGLTEMIMKKTKYKVYRITGFVILYTVEKNGKVYFTTTNQIEAHNKARELNNED